MFTFPEVLSVYPEPVVFMVTEVNPVTFDNVTAVRTVLPKIDTETAGERCPLVVRSLTTAFCTNFRIKAADGIVQRPKVEVSAA